MLGLAFQNPDMMFFTAFNEGECCLCSKKTRSFFLMSLNTPLCLDCFDIFFERRDAHGMSLRSDSGLTLIAEGHELYAGGHDEHV